MTQQSNETTTGAEQNAQQLVKARAAKALALAGGKTSRQRGNEKRDQALIWIYRWGWASPSTIEKLSGAIRSGLASRLVKTGYLRSTRTESGGGLPGVPSFLLTLTTKGLEQVERGLQEADDLLPYEMDPYRINQSLLRHDNMMQRATANSLLSGHIVAFKTPKELAARSTPGVKQPDSAWSYPDGRQAGVEVELTAKWSRDLDWFVAGIIKALSTVDGQAPTYDRFLVATDSPAIEKRYKTALRPSATYSTWGKDAHGKWKVTGTVSVPDWMRGRVLWKTLEKS